MERVTKLENQGNSSSTPQDVNKGKNKEIPVIQSNQKEDNTPKDTQNTNTPSANINPVNNQGVIRPYQTPRNFRGRSFSNDYFNPNAGSKRPFSTSDEDNTFKPYRMNMNRSIKRVQFNTNTQLDNETDRNTQNNSGQSNLSKDVANYSTQLTQLEGQITNFMSQISKSFAGNSSSSTTNNNNKPNDQ